ncbi:MAG: response regulator transcription factor [bacterium]|nr:response regulator transcription factor [bacterium]
MSEKPTVVVVDDDAAVRESLRWLIEANGLSVDTHASAEEFLEHLDSARPGCLLVDVRMPGMDGLTLQQQLRERRIGLPVIIITGHADVPMAIKAMKADAVDFVEKPFDDDALLDAIRRAIDVDRTERTRAEERANALVRISRLSPRERQVLELVAQGRSNREAAESLGIAEKTLEVHRANVRRKLEVSTLADLVRMAMCAGL